MTVTTRHEDLSYCGLSFHFKSEIKKMQGIKRKMTDTRGILH